MRVSRSDQPAVHRRRGHLGGYWRALLQAGEPGSFEARLRRRDGTYRWFLIRAVPQHDDAGQVVKWYGQNTDIDDRKRAELLLEGEKRLLEMMASGAPRLSDHWSATRTRPVSGDTTVSCSLSRGESVRH